MMTPAAELMCLRAGLLFCSAARRPAIEARIAAFKDFAPVPGGITYLPPGAPMPPPPPRDWRAARLALRQAGHEVKQYGAVVFVDGRPNDDPALYP